MKKIPLLLMLLLVSTITFSQTTNYYDANGNKIGSSKIVSTPESTLDKMIEQQRQQTQQGSLVPQQYSVEQKLKEYNSTQFKDQYNQRSEELRRRTELARKLEAELLEIENNLKTKNYSSEVRMMLQSNAQKIRNQIYQLHH